MASEVTDYLQEQAQAFVLDQLDIPLDAQADVKAGTIDERLPLTRCEDALTISLPARMEIRRNTTVYLKCEGDKSWDLYLPVRVSIQKPYVTVAVPVAKGDILSEPMLTLAYQDQTLIRGDYLTDPTALIGVRSKRELKPGQPIRLTQVCVVCKGDQVTLSAENSSMQIKTMARALQDGSFGDMIRLVNTRSGRTVQGQVSAVGSVIVTF
ncbi:flagellar basal body P-ring formation chaperone FlgA [Aeromonas caviae]|jgi:flagella basal body P-ring formation protein FlgA|nr:flagellar basal body P-ring formation chaperone FlgA [Aeromonas caviae]MCR3949219.1 flagellar basal body P-ring formation chaperone FlgA [Aeromonas caviae]MDH0026348.1 flagellar basal body P-ring formation chaperone FlgA [Aeromonas caviae]MDH1078100.1 flagellar basal body P-ring formation chaperone FlgA [Aeromonas caviae]MDK3163962.1 flagellar basal body P-ring formation chaperone FlgA [Aeromonas caviae]MDM5111980.1 flagellar basal body P-ring formation chaperone FlgA [Aeromonas caviae]